MISYRALGLLLEVAENGLVGGVQSLSGVSTEGRDALYTAMRELKKAGLVRTTTQRIGMGWYKSTEVTELGYNFLESRMTKFLESRVSIQQSPHNGILTSNSILTEILNKSTEQVREEYGSKIEIKGEGMSFLGQMDSDWDDIQNERDKDRKRKKEEFEEAKSQKAKNKYEHRQNKEISRWTVTDMTYEFAHRVQDMFHIPPWRVSNSRFAYAYKSFRDTYGTTPDIELKIMDAFFKRYAHETSITDAEILWRMFIKQAPSMIADARRQDYTDADMVAAKEQARKSLEDLI